MALGPRYACRSPPAAPTWGDGDGSGSGSDGPGAGGGGGGGGGGGDGQLGGGGSSGSGGGGGLRGAWHLAALFATVALLSTAEARAAEVSTGPRHGAGGSSGGTANADAGTPGLGLPGTSMIHTAADQSGGCCGGGGAQENRSSSRSSSSSSSGSSSSSDGAAQPCAAGGESAAAAEASEAEAQGMPEAKRIVLFVEPSPFTYTSGYQTRFKATIEEMVAAGCKVLVVTPGRGAAGLLPGGEAQPREFCGARVVESGGFPCPGYGSVTLSLGLSPRIWREVSAWKPDIIHVTSPGALPLAAWAYSRMLRVPLVASFHTHVPTYLPKLGLKWLEGGVWAAVRTIHRAAHLTIAVSPQAAADLVQAGACDPQTVKVWPKAVDCSRFDPANASPAMRARLEGAPGPEAAPDAAGAGAGAGGAAAADGSGARPRARGGGPSGSRSAGPLLLYVGRVSNEKNLELLRRVMERVPGARLAIVGDGPAMGRMRDHFSGTRTSFLGELRGADLAAAYASADIFVMPSETETLGNVVGEAMASGLPVVAAAAGGVPSVVGRPGVAGVLFAPGDADEAARAVRRLAADTEARRRMGREARSEMLRWSWRNATREILRDHYPAALALAKAAGDAGGGRPAGAAWSLV